MDQCRMCSKPCQSNHILNDRFFREKYQDIICMWVEPEHDPSLSNVCYECQTDILDFYSFKQQSRHILRGTDNRAPVSSNYSRDVSYNSNVFQSQRDPKFKIKRPANHSNRQPSDECQNKPKRPFRRKTDEEKAMDPLEYRRQYFQKAMEKYKQTCEMCGKRVPANLMEGHMNAHKGLLPYKCEVCGQCFNCKHNMRKHINRFHETGKEVPCPDCNQMLTCPASLKHHMRKVHAENKFECRICGKKMMYQNTLQRHLKIHTNIRDCICPHCGKAFYYKNDLTTHLRKHSGEKPYTCNICPKSFVYRHSYVMHMKKLHPEEPLVRLHAANKKNRLKQRFGPPMIVNGQ